MPSFFAAAGKEPAVISLYKDMSQSGEAREEALGHIHDLAQQEIDPRYENPSDTALAILLWLTRFAAPDYSYMAANIVDRAPQCWYGKKLARRILLPPPVDSGDSLIGTIRRGLEAGTNSGDAAVIMNPAARVKGLRHYRGASVIVSSAGNVTEQLSNWGTA
jgi:hypothetical protein